jgi:hypothetical protein
MAAKGYWETFKIVEQSIRKVFSGANTGEVADNEHGDWYRELFRPSVAADILKHLTSLGTEMIRYIF